MVPYAHRLSSPPHSALFSLHPDVAFSCVPRSATSSAAPSSASQSSLSTFRDPSQDGSSPSSSAATLSAIVSDAICLMFLRYPTVLTYLEPFFMPYCPSVNLPTATTTDHTREYERALHELQTAAVRRRGAAAFGVGGIGFGTTSTMLGQSTGTVYQSSMAQSVTLGDSDGSVALADLQPPPTPPFSSSATLPLHSFQPDLVSRHIPLHSGIA